MSSKVNKKKHLAAEMQRRQYTFLKMLFPIVSLVVGGWTPDNPCCLVEQFCPEYNEWRAAASMVNNRGSVAVGTLDGEIYTVGGEDNIRCYSSVER